MRKVYVNVTTRLIIEAEDDVEINELLGEMNYSFTPQPNSNADIVDTEIVDWEITDSK